MTSISIGDYVAAPALTPPPNGLLNSARVIDHSAEDTHWQGGISITPENFNRAQVIDPCDTAPVEHEHNRPGAKSFLPFPIETYDQCSTLGWQKADYEGRARRALAARETIAVEEALDTGAGIDENPHFQDEDNVTDVNGGTALSLNAALDAAVQTIADNNLGIGMIHARPGLVNAWNRGGSLLWRNNKIYTIGGHLVVPGAGYSGAAPDGTDPTSTSEWVYVTESLELHRGEVEVFLPEANRGQLVDRTNNTVEVRAMRMYSVVGNFPGIWGVHVNPST